MATPTIDISAAFETELSRLLALNLSPEETEIARRYYSQKERDSLPDSAFCGPHKSYPVQSQEDVDNAAGLAGHAADPAAVRACIRGKAKAHGWSLPKSWEEDDKKETSATPDLTREGDPGLVINADGTHAAFTGLHIHKHSAFGDQGNDDLHSHKHEHSGDGDHHHSHADETEKSDVPDILRSMPTETTIYAPILRVDRAKREVVVRATAEDLDSYGTVISYDGSKDAFAKWRGNIREMHDPTKAVGRAVKYEPKDETKEIELVLRVSKGAEDTWQKCLDGTLAGASIGARNGVWGKRMWNGKEVPFLERYDLVEVSLVDNPSCPGCDVKVVRADGMATDILDFTEEEATPSSQATSQQQSPDITRIGARVGTNTMSSMHKSRDHALQGLREQLANCSCDECQAALKVLDPDGDGDVDIVASLDTDNDQGGAKGDGSGDGSAVLFQKMIQAELIRQMGPMITRMNGIAARFAATDMPQSTTTTTIHEVATPDPDITRRLESMEQQLAGLVEVRSLLSEVKQLTERIAAQPQPGGPMVNSAALHNFPMNYQPDSVETATMMVAQLSRAGILDKKQQVDAVLYLENLKLQQAQNGRR